jgi:hypothetical protein
MSVPDTGRRLQNCIVLQRLTSLGADRLRNKAPTGQLLPTIPPIWGGSRAAKPFQPSADPFISQLRMAFGRIAIFKLGAAARTDRVVLGRIGQLIVCADWTGKHLVSHYRLTQSLAT